MTRPLQHQATPLLVLLPTADAYETRPSPPLRCNPPRNPTPCVQVPGMGPPVTGACTQVSEQLGINRGALRGCVKAGPDRLRRDAAASNQPASSAQGSRA